MEQKELSERCYFKIERTAERMGSTLMGAPTAPCIQACGVRRP
jgi:hypothetical protein